MLAVVVVVCLLLAAWAGYVVGRDSVDPEPVTLKRCAEVVRTSVGDKLDALLNK